jgi:hypothetical protein
VNQLKTGYNPLHYTLPTLYALGPTNQAIPNATWTDVTFNKPPVINAYGFASGSGTFVDAIMPLTALYLIMGEVTFAANATGTRGIRIVQDAVFPLGTNMVPATLLGDGNQSLSTPTIQALVVTGHTLRIQCYQSSGGALNIIANGLEAPQVEIGCLYNLGGAFTA